jgi:hypothetical protein
MLFNIASGFFAVVCRGSDGHLQLEHLVHKKCPSPEDSCRDESSEHRESTQLTDIHTHCNDFLATDGILAPYKNTKRYVLKEMPSLFTLTDITGRKAVVYTRSERQSELIDPFCSPLRTVIIIA